MANEVLIDSNIFYASIRAFILVIIAFLFMANTGFSVCSTCMNQSSQEMVGDMTNQSVNSPEERFDIPITTNYSTIALLPVSAGSNCKVDVIFVVDTSGSMDNEWSNLCGMMNQILSLLSSSGYDVRSNIVAIGAAPYGGQTCYNTIWYSGIACPIEPDGNREQWGDGVVYWSSNGGWRTGATRIIIPISDEGPLCGCNVEYNDLTIINDAISAAKANRVFVFPILGDSEVCTGVTSLMDQLAYQTGGQRFTVNDASTLANTIIKVISDNCGRDYPCSTGLYRRLTQTFWLDTNFDGRLDKSIRFGDCNDLPVIGDWTGSGKDGIGVFRPTTRTWWLDYNLDGIADNVIGYGLQNDIPIVGHWTIWSNKDGIGVFRPSTRTWYLDTNLDANPEKIIGYGLMNDIPIAGDWDHDGIDGIGVYRPEENRFYLDNNLDANPEMILDAGKCGDLPVSGCWLGTFSPTKHLYSLKDAVSGNTVSKDYDDTVDIPLSGKWL